MKSFSNVSVAKEKTPIKHCISNDYRSLIVPGAGLEPARP